MILIIVYAVFAAALNAGSTAMQRLASGQREAKELFTRRLALIITRHPLFLWGLTLQIGAVILQALALNQGPLIVVQPIMTLDLAFLFLIMKFKLGRQTPTTNWLSVMAIILSLGALYFVADPISGHKPYHFIPWLVIVCVYLVAITVLSVLARYVGSHKKRTVMIAIVTSCAYAMTAGLAKLVFIQLHVHGAGYVLANWPFYALLTNLILSIYLMQNAYAAGPLSISQPILESLSPTLSVVLGLSIFGDSIKHSALNIIGELICSGFLLWGIITLAESKEIYSYTKRTS